MKKYSALKLTVTCPIPSEYGIIKPIIIKEFSS